MEVTDGNLHVKDMVEFVRWLTAIVMLLAAIWNTYAVFRRWGHRIVAPVMKYWAMILWIAFAYYLIIALGFGFEIQLVRAGGAGAALAILFALGFALGGYATYQFTRNLKRNGIEPPQLVE